MYITSNGDKNVGLPSSVTIINAIIARFRRCLQLPRNDCDKKDSLSCLPPTMSWSALLVLSVAASGCRLNTSWLFLTHCGLPEPWIIIFYTLYFVFLIRFSCSFIIRKVFYLFVQAHPYARYCRWTLESFDGLLRISHPRETLRDCIPSILVDFHAFYTCLCTKCSGNTYCVSWLG